MVEQKNYRRRFCHAKRLSRQRIDLALPQKKAVFVSQLAVAEVNIACLIVIVFSAVAKGYAEAAVAMQEI